MTELETEITLYVKIDDPSELETAVDIEDHIQLENLLITGDKIRIRKVTPIKGVGSGNGDSYILTLKQKAPNDAGIPTSYETSHEVSREFYTAFAESAERAILKRRYSVVGAAPSISGLDRDIVIPALKYEIDQFTIPKTKEKSQWIKLDIELGEQLKALRDQGVDTTGLKQKISLSMLPFSAEEIINPENMTDEQKKTLGNLWETEFALTLKEPVFEKIKSPQT